MTEVTELVLRPCQCKNGRGLCFKKFKGLRDELCQLRMELKRMHPAECDLALSNMYHGPSELGLDAHEDDRVSSSGGDHVASDGTECRVESEGGGSHASEGRVNSSSDKSNGIGERVQQKRGKRKAKLRTRKRRYEHKILGQGVCRRSMKTLLGCRIPMADGKRRSGGRWLCCVT